MGILSDFLFGKKTLEKAAGPKKEEPKMPQSTDYLKEQIKNTVPKKAPIKPTAPGAMEKMKKGVK